jgi:hypothetical protein
MRCDGGLYLPKKVEIPGRAGGTSLAERYTAVYTHPSDAELSNRLRGLEG